MSTKRPLSEVDAVMVDGLAALDDALDADDPTLNRMWRYRAGGSMAAALEQLPRTRKVMLDIPRDEYAALHAVAAARGLSPARFVRAVIATHLRDHTALTAGDLPWLFAAGTLGDDDAHA